LLIHGILQLDGMDHATNEAAEPMIALQEKLLARLEEEHILPYRGLPPAGQPGEGDQ
jgi:probable rRNA maturation factor